MRWVGVLALAIAACGRHGFELPAGSTDATGATGDGVMSDGVTSDVAIPAGCGNGTVESGEDCDTAGASSGCTVACKLADQGNGGTCVTPVTLTLVPSSTGMGAMATGDTSTGQNGAQVSCTAANSLDRVYVVTLPSATTMTVTVTPSSNWNTALAIRDATLVCSTSTTLCCVDAQGANLPETSACAVPAGAMMIVVDSGGGVNAGPYTLTVSTP